MWPPLFRVGGGESTQNKNVRDKHDMNARMSKDVKDQIAIHTTGSNKHVVVIQFTIYERNTERKNIIATRCIIATHCVAICMD